MSNSVYLKYNKKFLPISSIWFYEENLREGFLNVVHDSVNPIPGYLNRDHYTLITDLTENQDLIFASFKKNTRYEIRRSENEDKFEYEYLESSDIYPELLSLIKKEYEEFCRLKEIKSTYNKYLINQAIKHNKLIITTMAKETKNYHFIFILIIMKR